MTKRATFVLFLAAAVGLAAAFLFVQGLALAQDQAGVASAGPDYDVWQVAANAPFAYTRFDAAYSPATDLVYVLGGRLADATTDGSVWQFNPYTGVYTDTGVDMPTPISNYEIAVLEDDTGQEVMVLFGGRPAAGGVVNTVQGYYPESNTTTTFASDPYPVLTSPGGVAVVDNIAYSFGGFDAVAVIADTYIFDILAPAGSRWTTGPDLSLARAYIATAVVDGVIYAMGGDTFDGASLFATDRTEKLDTANPVAWDDAGVADMPVVCGENRAFGLDSNLPYDVSGAVVVAGCGQWPAEIVESMLYDVATDSWDQAFPDLNLSRRNHAGAFVPFGPGGSGTPGYWVFGGRYGSDTTLRLEPEFYSLQEAPQAGFVSNSPVGLGDPMIFTNTTTGPATAYLWDFGDGFTDTLTHTSHVYAAASIYTVTLTASNAAGSTSFSQPVEVLMVDFKNYLPIVLLP